MRRTTIITLAFAVASLAGPAWADPSGDDADGARSSPVCDRDVSSPDAPRSCPRESGVIDHLPDSFFIGGGGVGPQVVETGGGEQVWVHAAGGGSASGSASASATASASVRVNVRAGTRGRW